MKYSTEFCKSGCKLVKEKELGEALYNLMEKDDVPETKKLAAEYENFFHAMYVAQMLMANPKIFSIYIERCPHENGSHVYVFSCRALYSYWNCDLMNQIVEQIKIFEESI